MAPQLKINHLKACKSEYHFCLIFFDHRQKYKRQIHFFSTFGKNTVACLINQKIKNKWPNYKPSKQLYLLALVSTASITRVMLSLLQLEN